MMDHLGNIYPTTTGSDFVKLHALAFVLHLRTYHNISAAG
jgi:hypothetical protein